MVNPRSLLLQLVLLSCCYVPSCGFRAGLVQPPRTSIDLNYLPIVDNGKDRKVALRLSCRPRETAKSATSRREKMSFRQIKKEKDPVESTEFLNDWIHHDSTSFHYFTPKEADAIRLALVNWYATNRRKLPWRGDPPPYDGSTAGIATKTKAKGRGITPDNLRNNDQANKGRQSCITSFFNSTGEIPKSTKISHTAPKTRRSTDVDNTSDMTVKDPTGASKQFGQEIHVSAYGVWVSEIMLQQTRVEAVIPFWLKWMKSFPTVYKLAAASEEQVNAHWAGLGFYRRARLLHQGAQHVVDKLNGEIPSTVEELKQISGIGPYTACAIASIAFDVCVPVVDGNVCRVLSRLRGIANHIKSPALKDKVGWELARQLVQAGDGKNAGIVNQALMELGATYCAPSATGVHIGDPLLPYYWSTKLGRKYFESYRSQHNDGACIGRKNGINCAQRDIDDRAPQSSGSCELCDSEGVQIVLDNLHQALFQSDDGSSSDLDDMDTFAAKCGHGVFPLEPPKMRKREEVLATAVLRTRWNEEDWWLLVKRQSKGLLAGQWEFPSVCLQIRNETTNPKVGAVFRPPSAQRRQQALTKLLKVVFSCKEDNQEERKLGNHQDHYVRRKLVPGPIVHIFSHVKHIMWVEASYVIGERKPLEEWTTSCGKEVRWMRQQDMKEVGITSGVKKLLKAVQNESTLGKDTTGTRKRKKR